jgi:Rrf2 family protein
MNGIVHFSEAASIALHTMTVLAGAPERHLTVHEIAEQLPVSETHLAKVLQRLVKAGLVDSLRGPRGGFLLRAAPAAITLLQVYESIEGPLEVASCAFPVAQGCRSCILDDALREANGIVRERLARTTLAELARTFRPSPLVALRARARAAPPRPARRA